ncbi:MAG: hypothetical protein ABIF19_17915, partial [Planctomycetota bacterium]
MIRKEVSRRAFLRKTMAWGSGLGLGGLFLAACDSGAKPSASTKVRKPNFLVIVADDMGYS